jgi:hypothetical protein
VERVSMYSKFLQLEMRTKNQCMQTKRVSQPKNVLERVVPENVKAFKYLAYIIIIIIIIIIIWLCSPARTMAF